MAFGQQNLVPPQYIGRKNPKNVASMTNYSNVFSNKKLYFKTKKSHLQQQTAFF
jgi:hypothetical protein